MERQYRGILDPIGPFRLTDLDGKVWTENDFKGKVLIVHQWAAWCGPCIAGFPETQKLADRVRGDESIAFVSLNLDRDPVELEDFLAEFRTKYSFPVLFAGARFKIGRLPHTWIVDREGFIRAGFSGEGADYVLRAMELVDVVKQRPPVSSLPADAVQARREQNVRDAERAK